MTQSKPRLKFTVNDYMSAPSDKRYQLLDGEMIVAPSPSNRHQEILGSLHLALAAFVQSRGIGRVRFAPLDVILSNHDVVQPDLLFVSTDRASIVTEANLVGAPDLVVEVLSPGTQVHDRGYKQSLYARHGVREYWLINPDAETLDVLTPDGDAFVVYESFGNSGVLNTPVMDGLSLDLERLFRRD